MKVIRAKAMGMCFGVRDALKVVQGVPEPRRVTIHGELVHNEEVNAGLAARGFCASPERDRSAVPATPLVLITAHGVSDRERTRLASAGKELIDTTCPLVRLVHQTAVRLQSEGHFVVVIGKRGHVEVEGIIGDLTHFAVVQNAGEACEYDADRIGIVCQSTTPPFEAEQTRLAIEAANPGKPVCFVDTICRPTRERQEAADELFGEVEAVVVVGGAHSNNTRQLARLAAARGLPVLHVQSAADLDADWLAPYEVVGLTAGTSTLDRTIDEVHQALLRMNEARPVPARERKAVAAQCV